MQETLRAKIDWAQLLPVVLVTTFVIVSDQFTKLWVRAHFALGEAWFADWPVRLRYVENTGSAFGLFPNATALLIVASTIAMGVVLYMFRQTGLAAIPQRLSLGLMLGGGTSNLADRIRFGSVTDFIDFRVWPIFNVADSSVVIGISGLVCYVLFRESRTRKPG